MEDIVILLRETIPSTPESPIEVRSDGKDLIVRGSDARQHEVANLLGQLREQKSMSMYLVVDILQIPRRDTSNPAVNSLRDRLIRLAEKPESIGESLFTMRASADGPRFTPATSPKGTITFDDVGPLLSAARATEVIHVLETPPVHVFAGQAITLRVGRQEDVIALPRPMSAPQRTTLDRAFIGFSFLGHAVVNSRRTAVVVRFRAAVGRELVSAEMTPTTNLTNDGTERGGDFGAAVLTGRVAVPDGEACVLTGFVASDGNQAGKVRLRDDLFLILRSHIVIGKDRRAPALWQHQVN